MVFLWLKRFKLFNSRNPKSIFYFQIKALIADFLHPLVIKGLVLPFQFDCIIIVINPYQRGKREP